MNKKLVAVLAVVLLAVAVFTAFAACDPPEGAPQFTLPIEGIDGVSDVLIDHEAKTVTFRVQNSVSALPLNAILFKDGAKLEMQAFTDKDLKNKVEGDSLPLAEGENVFYITGWFASAPEATATYEFHITRTLSAETITSVILDLSSWDENYLVNELFSGGKLDVTYKDGSVDKVDITADMVSGFDTSSAGKKDVTINYQGFTVTANIVVIQPADSTDLSLDSWQTEYFVGEELYLDGAYLLYNSANKIQITPDMVTGFDTSSAGEKEVIVAYAGYTVPAAITVYEFIVPEDETVTPTSPNRAAVEEALALLNEHIDFYGTDVTARNEICDIVIDILSQGGVTGEEFLHASKLLAEGDDSFFALLFYAIYNIDDLSDMIDAIVTDGVVEDFAALAQYVVQNLNGTQTRAILSALFAQILLSDPSATDCLSSLYVRFIDYTQLGTSSSISTVEVDNIDEIFSSSSDSEVKNFWEEFTQENDTYAGTYYLVEQALQSDEGKYLINSVLNLLNTLGNYDLGTLKELVQFGKNVISAVASGDLQELLGGSGSMSYKEMVEKINKLGELIDALDVYISQDPSALRAMGTVLYYSVTSIAAESDSIFNGYYEHFPHAAAALIKLAKGALLNLTPAFASELYLDYDDYAKTAEGEDKDEALGLLAAKVLNFLAPDYKDLSLKEKLGLRKVAQWFGSQFEIVLEPALDLLANWQAKPIEDISAQELIELGQNVKKAFSSASEYEMPALTISQSFPILVPVGADKAALAEAMRKEVTVQLYDSELKVITEITDFENYQLDYDASKEGFFNAVLTIEGNSCEVNCYAYDPDSSSLSLMGGSSGGAGFVFVRGQNISGIQFDDFLSPYELPTLFVHKQTGRVLFFHDVDMSTLRVENIDTSQPAGLYGAIGYYSHPAVGEVAFPIVYSLLDPEDAYKNITDVHIYGLPSVIVQGSELPPFAAEIVTSYVLSTEAELTAENVSGFDSSVLGEQEITVTVPGVTGFEYKKTITVITATEALTIKDASIRLTEPTDKDYPVFPMGEDVTANSSLLSFGVSLNFIYSDFDSYFEGSIDMLEKNLQEYGITLTNDISTAAVTSSLAGGKIVISLNSGDVLAEYDFKYLVYDKEEVPPKVVDFIDPFYDYGVYTASQASDIELFFARYIELNGMAAFVMSDGSTLTYAELAEQYPDSIANAEITPATPYEVSYNGHTEAKVTLKIDHFEYTVAIFVIPDDMANLPTQITAYDYGMQYIQYQTPDVGDFTVEIQLGYGYSVLQLDTSNPENGLELDVTTSVIGRAIATLTYQGLISTTSYVDVISMYDAFETRETSNPAYYDIEQNLYLTEGTENALMAAFEPRYIFDFYFMNSGGSMLDVNEYYAEEFPEFEIYLMIKNFSPEPGLHTAQIYIYGDNHHTEPIERYVTEVKYSVAPQEGETPITILSAELSREVLSQGEVDDGSWKELLTLYAGRGTEWASSITLEELEAEGAEIKLVSNDNPYYYSIEITMPYAYYRCGGYFIIPDSEANKLTGISIDGSYRLTMDLSNYTPVAGVDFKLLAEYGNGYKEEPLSSYADVVVTESGGILGIKNLTVAYNGVSTTLTVIDSSSMPADCEIIAGGPFNTSDPIAVGETQDDLLFTMTLVLGIRAALIYNVYYDLTFTEASIDEINETLNRIGLNMEITSFASDSCSFAITNTSSSLINTNGYTGTAYIYPTA